MENLAKPPEVLRVPPGVVFKRNYYFILPSARIVRTLQLSVDRPIGLCPSNGSCGYRTGPDVRQIPSDICQSMTSGLHHAPFPKSIGGTTDNTTSVSKAVRYETAYHFRFRRTRLPASLLHHRPVSAPVRQGADLPATSSSPWTNRNPPRHPMTSC